MPIPRIDPDVVHVTLGQYRRLLAADIPKRTFVLHDAEHKPVAVSVPYDTFLEMQQRLEVGAGQLAAHVGPETATQSPRAPLRPV